MPEGVHAIGDEFMCTIVELRLSGTLYVAQDKGSINYLVEALSIKCPAKVHNHRDLTYAICRAAKNMDD